MKGKARLCENIGMQQWGVNYWETYSPVVNWISVRSLLAIASVHQFTIISMDCVLDFLQYDIDVDVFMKLTLEKGVDGNRGKYQLKSNKSLDVLKKAS